MDLRAEKLAKARKKLRDHQEKKTIVSVKDMGPSDNQKTSQNMNNLGNLKALDSKDNDIISAPVISENYIYSSQEDSEKVNDILVTEKTALELHVKDLNAKLYQLELLHESQVKENEILKDKVTSLQFQLNTEIKKHAVFADENKMKDNMIEELQIKCKSINDEKNNLMEQLEVTKVLLKSKESDNVKLQNDSQLLYNQLEASKLQIQQLSNVPNVKLDDAKRSEDVVAWTQKVNTLQQQIEALQREKDNINSYYEQYVRELTEQLKSENLNKERYYEDLQQLQQRESSLIEQISEMEIRLQNFSNIKEKSLENHSVNFLDLQEKYKNAEIQLEDAKMRYNELKNVYEDSLTTIKNLSEEKERSICDHVNNISMTKLNDDIISDKVALQRAVQQNKKLKQDVEDLELVVVKMTKDKLELTEMLNHEKKLNKDLILKLLDIEESTKNMNNKLKAKDDEMMRLQSGYREIENKHGKLLQDLSSIRVKTSNICHEDTSHTCKNDDADHEQLLDSDYNDEIKSETDDSQNIPKMDAMHKLQERFLKIMNEVANLSDEKHRLEHIITQLQNETDTICEYVALYQQQRSLLKKREEERNHQISLFQKECNQLKQHIEELRYIILQIIDDPKLTSYFINEGIENEIVKAKKLLDIILNSSLVEAKFDTLDFNIFYPCNCCSGKLIDV